MANPAQPAATPEEHEARKAGWLQLFKSPEMAAFLTQFGIAAGQPRSIAQTAGGQMLNAVAAGGNAAGRVEQQAYARGQEAQKMALESRQVGAQEESAAANTVQAQAQKQQAETTANVTAPAAAEANRASAALAEEQASVVASDAAARTQQAQAQIQQAQAQVQQANTDAARQAAQAKLSQAQEQLALAQAEESRANKAAIEAGGPAGIMQDKLVQALTALGVDPNQARIDANLFANKAKGKTPQDVESMFLNSMLKYVDPTSETWKEDAAKARQLAREATAGVFAPPPGTPAPTSTPGAANTPMPLMTPELKSKAIEMAKSAVAASRSANKPIDEAGMAAMLRRRGLSDEEIAQVFAQ